MTPITPRVPMEQPNPRDPHSHERITDQGRRQTTDNRLLSGSERGERVCHLVSVSERSDAGLERGEGARLSQPQGFFDAVPGLLGEFESSVQTE